MQASYDQAMTEVFSDEGGYTDDPNDPGGPTNYGITIHDARLYWKSNATADDVKNMPKSVAEAIYAAHYAAPLHYNDLPPGLDYAVLDDGILSGTYHSARLLQRLVGATTDGDIGPQTLAAVQTVTDVPTLINNFFDARLTYLQGVRTWPIYGHGWGGRVQRGHSLAAHLWDQYKAQWQSQPPAAQPMAAARPAAPAAGAPAGVVLGAGVPSSLAPAGVVPAAPVLAAPVPSWLTVMGELDGTHWNGGPNVTIQSWLSFISSAYPNMAAYCASVMHLDYFEWCGLTVAYCMAKAQMAPVFGTVDTSQFLYAAAWLNWGMAPVGTPQPGDVIVFKWPQGGHHVTLFERDIGNGKWACHGGNQSHLVNIEPFPSSAVIGVRRPTVAAV
jgi:lysozyme family protein